MENYQIFTDATADLTDALLAGLPSVGTVPMEVSIGGKEYTYGEDGGISTGEFYNLQRKGNFASTSQINPSTYFHCFEPALRAGKDIIYICFSSGMSGTIHSAQACIKELQEEYPERRIICVDSLCASVGEGFLVREAARKQAEGYGYYDLVNWIISNNKKVCHWFTVDVFDHLKQGGRVSSAAAVAGTVLKIKPLLHVDEEGKLEVMAKPRGKSRAMGMQVSLMREGWRPDLGKLVVIGHGDSPSEAALLQRKVKEKFPEAEIYIADIGPIIGAHTGPGMLALIFWGDNR